MAPHPSRGSGSPLRFGRNDKVCMFAVDWLPHAPSPSPGGGGSDRRSGVGWTFPPSKPVSDERRNALSFRGCAAEPGTSSRTEHDD
jgi:hypothetical protein